MRLVPSQVLNCESAAERTIFGYLAEIGFSSYDIGLHSLNIGHHEYKRWGEADFFIISRRGILLLEVKGGRVACKDGIWEFTNRNDETSRKREGPAEQAKSAYFSLEKNYLHPKFYRELKGVPCGWAVVFTDIPRFASDGSTLLPEHPDEITAYEEDCKGHNSFRKFLSGAYDHWASKQRNPVDLPPEIVRAIASSLRPNFEQVPSLNSQLREVEQRLYQFTDEQYEKLDAISENDRILVTGGAGTGKTFVAAACARYEAAEGRSVLFITRSHYLATFLANQGLPDDVTVMTIEELPQSLDNGQKWDVVIVDEGQDLCSLECLDLVDGVLEGGWERGRWRWFGDPNYQVSPSFPVDQDCLDYLKSHGVATSLKNNIRNAGKIVEAIKLLAGADVGKPSSRPDSGTVDLQLVENENEILPRAALAVRKWLSDNDELQRNSIALLVSNRTDAEKAVELLSAKSVRAETLSKRALGGSPRDCVLVATVEDFKGLERPLVCVAGLGAREFASSAYKAISRANHALVLVATRSSVAELTEKAASGGAGGN
ncbi:AAA family ATPase [Sphingomonas sp. HDW15A]|uniref:nuclease-related domain-containing DEAD/DEAH box helicase n=1 Tax=Sphingomonas sp. HDW15A TaxID=2714942 RepID=UPI00140BB0FC|nr:AAA family ATPase [Sphingomonas sp. HDW15A]QIK95566.1 AAA family ATPase [Sphingomonas sp. HDW15A]